MSNFFYERFLHDVKTHGLQVLRHDGLYRHLRFKRPDTMCMHFDLLTWPGYLCYTGDMGTYVFRRIEDMFEFFRRPPGVARWRMDLRYWAEKLEGVDRADGVKAYSADKFRAEIERIFKEYAEQELDDADAKTMWASIELDVLRHADDGIDAAHRAARDFSYDRHTYIFDHFWEVDVTEYTHRFLWCCHALQWGIEQYDTWKQVSHVEV